MARNKQRTRRDVKKGDRMRSAQRELPGYGEREVGNHAGPKLISLATAADMLAVTKRSVYRLIAAGELPRPVKVGGASRMRESDVEAYIDRLIEESRG